MENKGGGVVGILWVRKEKEERRFTKQRKEWEKIMDYDGTGNKANEGFLLQNKQNVCKKRIAFISSKITRLVLFFTIKTILLSKSQGLGLNDRNEGVGSYGRVEEKGRGRNGTSWKLWKS